MLKAWNVELKLIYVHTTRVYCTTVPVQYVHNEPIGENHVYAKELIYVLRFGGFLDHG